MGMGMDKGMDMNLGMDTGMVVESEGMGKGKDLVEQTVELEGIESDMYKDMIVQDKDKCMGSN